jgi:hypothetical protein
MSYDIGLLFHLYDELHLGQLVTFHLTKCEDYTGLVQPKLIASNIRYL